MNIIFLATSLALLWVHLAAVTLAVGRWMPYPLARSAGVLCITLVMCLVEHCVGLGSLAWAWPLTTLAAIAVLHRRRDALRSAEFRASEAVLLWAVGFGLAWKWMFPSIYPTNDRYTDLYFMMNYFHGDRLPPLDIWFPPLKFNFYYAFQHYGAALMGRLFSWQPGVTYNIAFSLLMGLSVTLMWFFMGRFLTRTWAKWLLLVAIASGGSGISAYYPFLNDDHRAPDQVAGDELFANRRFIGLFDQQLSSDFGRRLFPRLSDADKPAPGFEPRIVGMESFGSQYITADYHPPVGGFFLLFLALSALAWVEAPATQGAPSRQRRLGQGLLGLTVPVVLITNAWVFPLASWLLAAWAAWRVWRREPPDWLAVGSGIAIGLALIYPFLSGLASESLVTPLRLVQPQDHTPPWRFVAYFWPLLVLIVLAWVERGARPLAFMFAVAFGLAVVAGEMLYVDDGSSDALRRYNTTAKWYGWIWSGALLACGAMALQSARRSVRAIAAASLLSTATCVLPLARHAWFSPKHDLGVFNGLSGEMRVPAMRQMLKYLKESPRGIVLDSPVGNGYSSQTMVAMFSGHAAMQGWPVLIGAWRRNPAGLWETFEETKSFYRGELPDKLNWLRRNDVRYVVWSDRDNQQAQAWNLIDQAVSPRYLWKPFQAGQGAKIGLWIRNDP